MGCRQRRRYAVESRREVEAADKGYRTAVRTRGQEERHDEDNGLEKYNGQCVKVPQSGCVCLCLLVASQWHDLRFEIWIVRNSSCR